MAIRKFLSFVLQTIVAGLAAGGEEPPEGPLHRVMDLHEEGKGVVAEDRAARRPAA